MSDQAEVQIEQILAEWEGRTTQKQRVTGSRLHTELLSRGIQVGVTTVRRILREIKRRQAEVYIPLVHRPGDEAQVDFFEVTVDIAGERRKLWMFLMRLMYSKRDFAWLYERCDQLAFLDGHVRAFVHFRGVPHRCVYDNLRPAVKKVVLPRRELTKSFAALVKHYLFEPCFARVARGDDKGGVEARGKGVRLQHLTPIPRGETRDDICQRLVAQLDARAQQTKLSDGRTIRDRFVEEQCLLLPAAHPYQAQRTHLVSVDKTSMVQVEGARYSLPSAWARLDVTAHVRVEDVEFACRGLTIVRKRGQKGERVVLYRDYLSELARKPQAVRQVAQELMEELGQPFGELWSLLMNTHGPRDGSRVMAKVLQAVVDHGENRVKEAICKTLATGRFNLLWLDRHRNENRRAVPVPPALAGYKVEAARAADFDHLLLEVSA